ncbi:Iporin [Labeo rohita]|uniref:Iporin n=1 Tax=Labeo rohita TaxID=84645 RepID=A0ABQ8MMR3_LABRO|nr:Iporin [Labeo rohita]
MELESATSERSFRDDKVNELLEVVTQADDRLKLDWPQEQETLKRSKLDDRFLSGGRGEGPQRQSLPFFGNLWGASPTLLTYSLVGKAYKAAGQAGAALHTMVVLQAYQADLLKDISAGGTIDEEVLSELCRTTDLSLRATKQTGCAIGCFMAAMVSTERHLWLNLMGIKERERAFLLDAQVSPLRGVCEVSFPPCSSVRTVSHPVPTRSGLHEAGRPEGETSAPFRETGSVEATARYLFLGRITDSAGQRGHRTCFPARQRVRLLEPILSGSQERLGAASNFGSSWVKPRHSTGHRKFLRFTFSGEAYQYQSQELALQHRDVVLAHLISLGLRLNAKKGVLSPAQRTTYMGVLWDSITIQAQLSSAHVESILNILKNIKLSQKSQGISSEGLTLGPTLDPCCRCTMLTTDASLTGWGAALSGHPAQGIWRGHLLDWHISCLEMMAVFPALKFFLQQLRGYHVPVRVDNTVVDKFLSLRAIYILGHMNMEADFLSRQAVIHGEWKFHPAVVSQIWERFYEAGPCFTEDCTMSPLLLSDSSSFPGSGRDGPYVAQSTSLRFSPDCSAPGSHGQGPSTGVSPLTDSAPLADQSVVLRSNIPPLRLAVGDSGQERSPISDAGDSISSPARALEPLCLAPEEDQLRDAGLPADVVETILSARAPSTRRSYALKWRVFKTWCVSHHAEPVHCQVDSVLEFLQEKLSSETSPGTLTISACHTLIDGGTH